MDKELDSAIKKYLSEVKDSATIAIPRGRGFEYYIPKQTLNHNIFNENDLLSLSDHNTELPLYVLNPLLKHYGK